jgi:hypothetical protein
MKIVVNDTFGGFHYPEEFCKCYNDSPYDWMDYTDDDEYRFHDNLIDWVETNPQDSEGLRVIDIPDNVTDWQIHEYDGLESIICVIDGKIVWL